MGLGSIPGRGPKILQAAQRGQKKKKIDVTIVIIGGHHKQCPYKMANLINVWVLTVPPTSHSHLSPSPWASLFSEIQQYWN